MRDDLGVLVEVFVVALHKDGHRVVVGVTSSVMLFDSNYFLVKAGDNPAKVRRGSLLICDANLMFEIEEREAAGYRVQNNFAVVGGVAVPPRDVEGKVEWAERVFREALQLILA